MILSTAVAKSLKNFADAVEGASDPKTAAAEYIKQTLTDHQRIIFNGNGYADEWEVEAAKRGLANNRNTAEALPAYVADKSVALFGEMGVLSESEIESRYECKLERYCKLINIEARVMRRMTRRTFLPAINGYASEVAASIERYKTVSPGAKVGTQEKLLANLRSYVRSTMPASRRSRSRTCKSAPISTPTPSFRSWTICAAWSTIPRPSPIARIGRCRVTTTCCSTSRLLR